MGGVGDYRGGVEKMWGIECRSQLSEMRLPLFFTIGFFINIYKDVTIQCTLTTRLVVAESFYRLL